MLATFTSAPSNDTAASLQAWGKALSDALGAVGLTKTADTGQVDWATVTAPAEPGGVAGYEMWQSADTPPMVVKVEYGSSPAGAAVPACWIAVGVASDGTGNLAGPVLLPRLGVTCDTYDTATCLSYVAYSKVRSSLIVGLWANCTAAPGSITTIARGGSPMLPVLVGSGSPGPDNSILASFLWE